ncbi:MAG: hypothetical protein V1743_00090 [Nanoarchaeota archaeon]
MPVMQDKTLLAIALTASILCVSILFILSKTVKLEETKIDQIAEKKPGDKVSVTGKIEKISTNGKTTFLEISQECTLPVILFESENLSSLKNAEVEIIGTYQVYNDKPEVVAEEIRKFNKKG